MSESGMDAWKRAFKELRSRDARRVQGAYGQLSLWPDEYVDNGWKRRDTIRMFPQLFHHA